MPCRAPETRPTFLVMMPIYFIVFMISHTTGKSREGNSAEHSVMMLVFYYRSLINAIAKLEILSFEVKPTGLESIVWVVFHP